MTHSWMREALCIMAVAGSAVAAGPACAQTPDAVVVPAEDTSPVDVPSGQPVTPIDVILNEPGPTGTAVRFRFLAPEIAPGGSIGFDVAAEDMLAICNTFALPRLDDPDTMPDQIIISLSDRILPFGQTDDTATQFFEAYRIEGQVCVWEVF
jgi:Family of unknown function (DUF6497)